MVAILFSAAWIFLIPISAKASLPLASAPLSTDNFLAVDVRNLTRGDLKTRIPMTMRISDQYVRSYVLGRASDAEVPVGEMRESYEQVLVSGVQECNSGACIPLGGIQGGRRPY